MLRITDIKKLNRSVMMSQNRLQAISQARETHRVNIQKSLEHRLQVAKAKSDEQLIHQLEAEIKYIR
jgi:flagellar biosynthesis chaperone FliJ